MTHLPFVDFFACNARFQISRFTGTAAASTRTQTAAAVFMAMLRQ
jgi:hypothetical protein